MSFAISGMRLYSPEQSITVPLEAKSLEFNFQSTFTKNDDIPGATFGVYAGSKPGTSEHNSDTRI